MSAPRRKILTVNIPYYIRTRQTKYIIITFLTVREFAQNVYPREVLLRQITLLLYHSAHSTVQNKNALTHQRFNRSRFI